LLDEIRSIVEAAAMTDTAGGTEADAERLLREASAHYQARRLAEAEALLQRLPPKFAARSDHQLLSGHLQRARGRAQEAMGHFRQALAVEPGSIPARLALASLLFSLGRRKEVRAELEAATAYAGDDARALRRIAIGWNEMGDANAAIRTMRRVVALEPHDLHGRMLLRDLQSVHVRPWHFRMMNDRPRNRAYDQAIRRAVGPDRHVLEIGTGSGLLAMIAARAGAGLVTTCEKVEVIAEAAAEIVARNGYGDRIRVIPKASDALQVGVDLPRRADLLISEILSDELLGEQVLRSTADARRRLLEPGGQLIPRAISAVVRLVGGAFLAEATSVGEVEGFDLTPFNRFAPSNVSINMESGAFDSLSDDMALFRFDLAADGHRPQRQRLTFTAQCAGTAVGLLQWVRLELDDTISFENRPGDEVSPSAWRHVLHSFPAPIALVAGEQLTVHAQHNLNTLMFWPER
jgi:type II protein arginine methyltransferase